MNGKEAIRVLIVEDDWVDHKMIEKQLRGQRRTIVFDWAETYASAAEKLDKNSYDIILTDLSLPDSHGLSTVSKLKAKAFNLPIIVLTSLDDERIEQQILGVGAQDYIVKGDMDGRSMNRAISHAIQRQAMQNEVQLLLSERESDQILLLEQAALLKKKNRRLRRLYKTAQEFVDNISHDFRTPLTVIKDYVSIIREGLVGDINTEQQCMLDKVSIRAGDLNNMVDDLLDVSKLESGLLGAWRRNVSIKSIFERAESMLMQRAHVRNVDLVIECDENLPEVYCDAEMIGRVVTNLAVNAIKFTNEDAKVRLWAQVDHAENQVVVGVTDNGRGIDEESLQKIFKRFRQIDSHVKSTVKGFGLGLNIAHQLCRLNLGELNVQSRIGEGSTFSFTVPFADPIEVMRRWLKRKRSSSEILKMIEIEIDNQENESVGLDFDNFLTCLLRQHDLLFRLSENRWLLAMTSASSESKRWFQRADEEFKRRNRNRPAGPLPDYRVEIRGKWNSLHTTEEILGKSKEILDSGLPLKHTIVESNLH